MSRHVPCPFVYSAGKKCEGVIERAWQRANVRYEWTLKDGEFQEKPQPDFLDATSHIHLECSLKGNHTGARGRTPDAMKVWELPEAVLMEEGESDK